jgi:hypothetical protein
MSRKVRFNLTRISKKKLIETKKVLLYIKLSKLVKNGANIFYFLTPIFCQIGYFWGIKVTIGAKIIQKWGKNLIFPV